MTTGCLLLSVFKQPDIVKEYCLKLEVVSLGTQRTLAGNGGVNK